MTKFLVYTAAADAGTSLIIRARSLFVLFLRIPQRTPFAEVISEGKRSYTDEQRAGDLAAAGILLNTAKEIYESGDSMNETAANEVFKRPAEV